MSDIDNNEIRRLDGGLLLVFRELMRRGRTTSVASHLGLSQSAVSHALGRLRDIFGDALFLRRPHGLEPTPRAEALAPRVEALIDLMGAAIRPDSGFDPAASTRWFSLAGTEFAHGIASATLANRVRAAAPGVTFSFQHLRGHRALEVLRRGRIDLAVGRFDSVPDGCAVEPLYEDRYCVVARKDHPTLRGLIDMRTWRRTGHVFVATMAPDDDIVSPTIGEDPMPQASQVVTTAVVPRWETALEVVAGSDAIATGPRRLAERYAAPLGLQIIDPPYPAPGWTISMARRSASDPGLDWFRGEVRAALAEVPGHVADV